MSLVVQHPDFLDRAQESTANDLEQRLARNAANGVRDFIILFTQDGITHEDRFTGTKDERLAHMQTDALERDGETISPLGLDIDATPWASGFYDWSKLSWHACGTNPALIRQIKDRPRPVR
jgi:hypothetical protein